MEHLDRICAQTGAEIAHIESLEKGQKENLITKTLGVLQEDGIYAMFLFLLSRNKKEIDYAEKTVSCLKQLLQNMGILPEDTSGTGDTLTLLKDNLFSDLDKVLFAKELLERSLVFARYHIKALPKPEVVESADGVETQR